MKVCIDPGHGMSNRKPGIFDSGAVHVENGFQHQEAVITLKYGLTLKDVFRARQVDVFMTRDDQQDHAPVTARAKNAKNAGCNVFVALHMNDNEDDSANGLEVLFRDDDDKALAQKMQTALVKVTKLKDRKIEQRTDLAVLKFQGTAILIELGFIANDKDRETLLNPQTREQVCITIADVVQGHFSN